MFLACMQNWAKRTNVMYIFVNLRKLKKKKKNKEQKNQSTIWVNRSYDNFKVKLVSLQAKVPLKWPHIL